MSEPRVQLRFVTYDADGRIDQELACLNCGYNLRSLHDDADCPECGESVYDSAKRALLCQHDPIWLRRLTDAAVWIAVAFGCFVLLVTAALIMKALQVDSADVLFLVVIPVIGIVVGPIGFWKITAPHHCRGIRWVRVRALARWMVAAGFVWFLLAIIAEIMQPLLRSDEPFLWLIRCCLVCLGVAVWATHTYVAGLAAKMPQAKLAKYTRFVGWGFVLCLALDLVMTITESEALGQLSIVGLYALSIGSIALSIGYRRGFRQALTRAQQGAEGQAPECGHGAEQERQFYQSQRRAKAKSADPSQPYKPKRRRWPWGLLALVLLAAGTLGIVRYTLHRRVAVKLAQLRAEGYPTTLSELDAWYVIPSGANAADAYLEAFDAYVKDEELEALLPGFMANGVQWPAPDEPMPTEMLAAVESLLAQNTRALALLVEAASIRECRYPIDLTKGIAVDLPHLAELRWGTGLLLCQANLEARRGNGDQVVEAVAALLAASNSLAMEPEHSSQMVRVAIQSEGCRTVERLLSGDEWTDVQLARLSKAFAGAIDRGALPHAMAGLRAILLDASDIFDTAFDTAGGKIVFFRLLGSSDVDRATFLAIIDELIKQPEDPLGQASKIAAMRADVPVYCLVTNLVLPGYISTVRSALITETQLQMMIVGLAAKRYELAHDKLPANLNELVPEFLDAVPADPFDGKPLRYKQTVTGAMIYSVGSDGIDDGGRELDGFGHPFADGTDLIFELS